MHNPAWQDYFRGIEQNSSELLHTFSQLTKQSYGHLLQEKRGFHRLIWWVWINLACIFNISGKAQPLSQCYCSLKSTGNISRPQNFLSPSCFLLNIFFFSPCQTLSVPSTTFPSDWEYRWQNRVQALCAHSLNVLPTGFCLSSAMALPLAAPWAWTGLCDQSDTDTICAALSFTDLLVNGQKNTHIYQTLPGSYEICNFILLDE